MRKTLSLLIAGAGLVSYQSAQAQRFYDEVFTNDQIVVHSNIVFGTNIDFLTSDFSSPSVPAEITELQTAVFLGNPIPAAYFNPADDATAVKVKNITMDIYEPDQSDDTYDNRPVIVYIHTGNFLPPPINGSPNGTKTDSSAVELCKGWARRGYVAISCDYRLGWNPIAATVQERRGTLLNAVYRAIHDVKEGVRFLREDSYALNTWNIDESKIVLYGQGSGGYVSQAYVTLDNPNVELYLPKFLPNPFNPSVSYIDSSQVGNFEGFGGLVNLYQNEGVSSDVHMAINAGGALADESWLEAGDVPMIAINCVRDDFAPFTAGTVIVPTTLEEVVDVHGGNFFIQKAVDLGNNNIFVDLPDGDPFTDAARSRYGETYTVSNGLTQTVNATPEGLFPILRSLRPYLANESSPWEWWDPTSAIAQVQVAPGITAHMASLNSNPDMSPAKGRAYIDSIQGYILPRIMCVLELPNSPCENLNPIPFNDDCADAEDIDMFFHSGENVVQLTDTYDNSNGTVANDDPTDGWDCFGEPDGGGGSPSIDNTIWFTFEGDGEVYNILTNDCNGTLGADYIFEGDTQMAIYTGSCGDFTPVACVDDSEDAIQGNYFAELDFPTEDGQTYFIMVDGFDWSELGEDGPAEGQFCIQITQIVVGVDEIAGSNLSIYPNPAVGQFTIDADARISSVNVYNVLGELVSQLEGTNASRVTVDATQFDPGVYIINAFVNGAMLSSRIIVQ